MGYNSAYDYRSYTGTAGAAWTTFTFPWTSGFILMKAWNAFALIQFQLYDGSWGQSITLDPDSDYVGPLPHSALGFRIMNQSPTANADYDIIAELR